MHTIMLIQNTRSLRFKFGQNGVSGLDAKAKSFAQTVFFINKICKYVHTGNGLYTKKEDKNHQNLFLTFEVNFCKSIKQIFFLKQESIFKII